MLPFEVLLACLSLFNESSCLHMFSACMTLQRAVANIFLGAVHYKELDIHLRL